MCVCLCAFVVKYCNVSGFIVAPSTCLLPSANVVKLFGFTTTTVNGSHRLQLSTKQMSEIWSRMISRVVGTITQVQDGSNVTAQDNDK